MVPLRPVVERLTSRPVRVLNSHTHYDHVGGNTECREVLARDTLHLGGRVLEVLAVPGHAPDATALLDREHGLLFTGVAFHVPHFAILTSTAILARQGARGGQGGSRLPLPPAPKDSAP
ncbi:hypothetical protein [Gemmatimonas sp.]|jgi:glyoxylase-like metal-dependent hydrolase (beta-lactamase superfamily II)|uniref:hypothetical protein n=1 Tax=Gemmatimonas sp. TaxID=1962908 RepID=UPI0037C0852B